MSNEPLEAGKDLQVLLSVLENELCHQFSAWPNPSVPTVAAGVYTIWNNGQLIYVGMSGRGFALDAAPPDGQKKVKGLWTRLNSHAAGRRSGDQFCVYVCDRFVVPHLTGDQQDQIGEGVLSLDGLTKTYIHTYLGYRYVILNSGSEAYALERAVQKGALNSGKPLLNPM